MKWYFTSRQIPALADLSLRERFQHIQTAQGKLTAPEKLLLNIIKLSILIPFFVLILRISESWMSLFWAMLVIMFYPLILNPVQYSLCAKYIDARRIKVPEQNLTKE